MREDVVVVVVVVVVPHSRQFSGRRRRIMNQILDPCSCIHWLHSLVEPGTPLDFFVIHEDGDSGWSTRVPVCDGNDKIKSL